MQKSASQLKLLTTATSFIFTVVCAAFISSPGQAAEAPEFTFLGTAAAFDTAAPPPNDQIQGKWMLIGSAENPAAIGLFHSLPGYHPDGKWLFDDETGFSVFYLDIAAASKDALGNTIYSVLRSRVGNESHKIRSSVGPNNGVLGSRGFNFQEIGPRSEGPVNQNIAFYSAECRVPAGNGTLLLCAVTFNGGPNAGDMDPGVQPFVNQIVAYLGYIRAG